MSNYDWRQQRGLLVGYSWFFNTIRYLRTTPPEFSRVFPVPTSMLRPSAGVVWCVLA